MVTKKDLSIAVTECLAEQGMTEEQIAASLCCGELDSFDEGFWTDFGGLAVLTACGLEVGGNVCDIEFVVDGTHCLCGLQFGSCLDVEGANKAIALIRVICCRRFFRQRTRCTASVMSSCSLTALIAPILSSCNMV